MELNPKFSANQIRYAFDLLQSNGIEPTAPTLKALIETAESLYPNQPDSLEKATQSMLGFFTGSEGTVKREYPWNWLRQWAFLVLRI